MTTPIRVLELRSVWGTGGGPDKTILAGAKQADPSRFAITVCYIRDKRDAVFSIDKRAAALSIDYVEILERHSFDHRVWPMLRQLVRQRQIHIVHAHDHKTDAITWALARSEPILPLSTAHGFSGYSRSEKIYYAIEKRILARFPRVIAVSVPIRDELIRTGSRPERITVINNGIDHRVFRRDRSSREKVRRALHLNPDAIVIAGVGRLEIEKRFDLLIEALARLRPRYPRVELVIVGEGTVRPALERQSAALGVSGAVRLSGHQSDIVELHSAFDLFVQTSEREGTPNALLEAMALETPAVATNVGGTAELMTDGVHGLLVEKNNAPALAAAMDRALSDPAASAQRASAARRRIETDLSFDRRMRKVEAIYEELIRSRRGAPPTATE